MLFGVINLWRRYAPAPVTRSLPVSVNPAMATWNCVNDFRLHCNLTEFLICGNRACKFSYFMEHCCNLVYDWIACHRCFQDYPDAVCFPDYVINAGYVHPTVRYIYPVYYLLERKLDNDHNCVYNNLKGYWDYKNVKPNRDMKLT